MQLKALYLSALLAGSAVASNAQADNEAQLLRQELQAARSAFEARVAALESRIQELESQQAPTPAIAVERLDRVENRVQQLEIADSPVSAPPSANASALNPQMSVILAGSWNNLSEQPEDYVLQGFIPSGGETGPGERGFNLGESEMTLSANIDPLFYGQVTLAISPEDEIAAEEAFIRSSALPRGFTAQFGRFLSTLGYVNGQHAHAWDFIDVPLVYQAMFGGQYKTEGLQLKWLAPFDTFVEFGVEVGNGRGFPGADNGNGPGSYTLFAATGDDIGDSASWKAGLAWLYNESAERAYEEADPHAEDVLNPTVFNGDSETWSAYLVYKWAPHGNSRDRSFKFQTEYIDRREDGVLAQDNAAFGSGRSDYRGSPSGWYAQGIYQFRSNWRLGLRYERLDAGDRHIRSLDAVLPASAFASLSPYDPERGSLMLDWSPTEFSRIRLQYAHEQNATDADQNQVYLQYLMSLGSHGTHQF